MSTSVVERGVGCMSQMHCRIVNIAMFASSFLSVSVSVFLLKHLRVGCRHHAASFY